MAASAILGFALSQNGGPPQEAISWLQFACEHGRGDAAHNLGMLYLGLSRDPEHADKASEYDTLGRFFLRRAHEMGFVVSTTRLF